MICKNDKCTCVNCIGNTGNKLRAAMQANEAAWKSRSLAAWLLAADRWEAAGEPIAAHNARAEADAIAARFARTN